LLEREFDQVPWTIQQTFASVLFTLLPWLTFSFLLTLGAASAQGMTHTAPVSPTTPQPTVFSPQQDITNAIVGLIIAIIGEGIFLIAPAYFTYRTTHHELHPQRARWQTMLDTLGFRRFKILRSLGLVILFFLGLIIVNDLYDRLITVFHLQIQTNAQKVLEHGRLLPITTYTSLAAAVLIAPICEEVFFRSFTFMGLRNGMPLAQSIVISGLIFAVAHGDPGSFPVLFVIGLALAVMRWRTYSIWPGIILHTLNNGLSALLIILSLHGIS
jgi:uncharacterized protein